MVIRGIPTHSEGILIDGFIHGFILIDGFHDASIIVYNTCTELTEN